MSQPLASETRIEKVVPFLWVTDIEASLRFYAEALGMEVIHRWAPEGKLRWCWLRLDGAALMLQELSNEGPHAGRPEGRLGEGISLEFQCKDALSIYQSAGQRGSEARDPFVGNQMWVVAYRDPDGYAIHFESSTNVPEGTTLPDWLAQGSPAGQPLAPGQEVEPGLSFPAGWPPRAPEPGNVKQVAPLLNVDDMERSLKFYRGSLGFEMKYQWNDSGRIRWCWLQRDGAALMIQEFPREGEEGWEPHSTLGQGVSLWFQCLDALRIYEEMKVKGLTPDEPIVGNRMWDVSVRDPHGYALHFESPTEVPEGTRWSAWSRGGSAS